MENQVRQILREEGRLAVDVNTLGVQDDLYAAGLSSLATVNVMLGIEETFGIQFPDEALCRRSFQSIGALLDVVETLKQMQAV